MALRVLVGCKRVIDYAVRVSIKNKFIQVIKIIPLNKFVTYFIIFVLFLITLR